MMDTAIIQNEIENLPTLTELDKTIKVLTGSEHDFESLDKYIQQLEQLIFKLDEEDESILELYYQSLDPSIIKITNDLYCYWETETETQFAIGILDGTVTDIKEYVLYERFKTLISNELNQIKDLDFKSLLFIGSGPFPITAILLHQLTGKVVDCLELEKNSADISNQVLCKLGINDGIRILVGNGCHFEIQEYDVILKALLAKPKKDILKNIRTKNPKARILCRTSFGLRRLVYEPTMENAFNNFVKLNWQFASGHTTISTVLLHHKSHFSSSLNFKWIEVLDEVEKEKLSNMMNKIILKDNSNGFLSVISPTHPYMTILERDLECKLKHLLVVESNGEYLGQFILEHSYVDSYKFRAEVSTLMLDESIRGKKASLEIIVKLFEKCDSLNVKYLTLSVRSGSKAELLWKYLGFESYGKLPGYSYVAGQQYEGIYMYKDVESLRSNLYRKMDNMYVD